MSALGHKRTFGCARAMSALPRMQTLPGAIRMSALCQIQDEDDTQPVFQRIPLVDLAIEIELRGLANLGRQNTLNLRHVRARGEGADGQNLGGRRLRHRCLSNDTVGSTSQDRGGSQISERTFDHGRTFLKRVGFSRSINPSDSACCARAAIGHIVVPPMSERNCRRLMNCPSARRAYHLTTALCITAKRSA